MTSDGAGTRALAAATAQTRAPHQHCVAVRSGGQAARRVRAGTLEARAARNTATKNLAWLDNFTQIGDIIVQYNPHHFALPWAGVGCLLEV